MLVSIDPLLDAAKQMQKDKRSGQGSLFGGGDESAVDVAVDGNDNPYIAGTVLTLGKGKDIVVLDLAKQDYRLFYTAGLQVEFRSYTTTYRIHPEMLRDVDRWVQDHILEEDDPPLE